MANTKKRKRSRSDTTTTTTTQSIPWEKVDVSLLAPSQAAAGTVAKNQDDEFETGVNNHYDQPSSRTYRSAEKELEADPAEGVGIFFGLEVIDGSQYRVVEQGGTKRLVLKEEEEQDGNKAKRTTTNVLEKSDENTDEKDASTTEKVETKKKKKKKQKKKKKKQSFDPETTQVKDTKNDEEKDESAKKQPSKKNETKKTEKQKLKSQEASLPTKQKEETVVANDEKSDQEVPADNDSTDPQIHALQTSWMTATGGVTLHEILCKSLLEQQFWTPTPIQAASLPAATLGRRNIVGAAPTGSGKTLAYLLPIFEYLLKKEGDSSLDRKVHALILAPTRELALQVRKECNKLIPGKCGVLVGGLATQKQERVLRKNKPPIIIATPGRLWEMVSSREHEHLNDLSQIAFLVIDECDRMTEQGSFPQLHSILDAVEKANPRDSDDEDGDDDEFSVEGNADDPDRLLSLPGVRGEARVVMLNDDILAQIENERNGEGVKALTPVEVDNSEFNQLDEDEESDKDALPEEDELSLPGRPPVQRQTFVYSATLTLPPSASYIPSRNKKRKVHSLKGLEGAIEEILDKARARGQTKVIDLSNSKKQAKYDEKIRESKERGEETNAAKQQLEVLPRRTFNLPPGLKLQEIQCTQMHKDSHLYAYLVTTKEGASGPCLVFCNSIAGVRRVGKTLQALGLPVRMLHANLEQRARFRSVESLQHDSRAVVVATDIAARGLDIPNVASVVHYDVARKVDGFVHRAGRTARGMGEKAVGSSLSLISPAEDKAHRKIVAELNVEFQRVPLDSRLLSLAQERTNLASKVISAEEIQGKASRNNQWFINSAMEAGLEVDEDVFDEGLAGGNIKEQQQLRVAQLAKGRLKRLLAEPMVTQRYGKFLSSNTAAAKAEVAPYVVQTQNNRSRKRRKRDKH